jgi:spore coat protein U-like protein
MARGFSCLGVLLALLLAPRAAGAATNCAISGGIQVLFGNYDFTSPIPTDTTGDVHYNCNNGGALITLSTGSSGTYSPRTLLSGADQLAYNLYVDAARTQVWGDFTGGTTVQIVPAGSNQTIQIFGRIPVGQNVPAGTYSDTVVVTFFF